MMTGLNKAYEVAERPWWKVVSVMFGLTISLSVLYVIALAAGDSSVREVEEPRSGGADSSDT
jgi:hypothetical protein